MALVERVSWQELVRRTVRETLDDDCLGLAAQLSYYFFLSLFPALLFLVALSSFFRLSNATDDVARVLGSLLSPEIITLVQEQMRRLAEAPDGRMAMVGLLGAFWSSSAAIVAIVTAVNRAYDLTETRPWWRIRLTAIFLTLFLGVAILAALALLLAGPGLASLLGVPADSVLWTWTWSIARWPLAFVIMAAGVGVLYHYAPNAEQDWVWVTPGALVGTALWVATCLIFKLYIAVFANYEAAYGSLAGVAVLLLWFYLSGLGVLVGAELNSEIEQAAEHGDSPIINERTGRRLIGARAARAFARRRHAAHPKAEHKNTQARPVGQSMRVCNG